MKIQRLVLALLFVSGPALAADIDGKWTGTLDTPGGPVPVSYTFKAKGATLTGTSAAPDGTPFPIKDGKIAGDKISYSLDVDFGQGPITFVYSGVVSHTELKLHTEFMGMPIDFTLKKAS
jgi:hypothetical protein